MRLYVASSWRNKYQPTVVERLRQEGFDPYDFRVPRHGEAGFAWSQVDPNWKEWSTEEYRKALKHPTAEYGFNNDLTSMKSADAFVLVLPSGRSAHLEAGWAIGQGVPTAIYMPESVEPELMYKLAEIICIGMDELLVWLKDIMPTASE